MRTRAQARREELARRKLDFKNIGLEDDLESKEVMADQAQPAKALSEFSQPKVEDIHTSIVHPAIGANNFELKPNIIQMIQNIVQFGGSPAEDPNAHIRDFLEICDTFKCNGVTDDAIRLRLFPFSLRDKAKSWLHSLPSGSITTWAHCAQKFLMKYFSMAKTAAYRNSISQFAQQPQESLGEAWERYKEILARCPHHGMPDWMIISNFYNGLGAQSRPMLDAASGGALWAKSYEDAYNLIEMMAANEFQNPTQRLPPAKVAGVLDLDAATAIAAQLKALTMKVDSLSNLGTNQVAMVCELCAGAHDTNQCAISAESAQFVSNFQRAQQPVPNVYHPNNRNHPNFSWSNNQGGFQQPQNQQFNARPYNQNYQPPPYAPRQPFNPPGFQPSQGNSLNQSEKSELEELRMMYKSQAVSLKTLENQIGQLANALLNRQPGTLPSDTEMNLGKKDHKEQVQAVTLRSGRILQGQKF